MRDKEQEEGNLQQNLAEEYYPPAEITEELLSYVLGHYIKHHKVVLTKLNHAQKATEESIAEIKQLLKNIEETEEIKKIKLYDNMWGLIIETFRQSGVSEDELNNIENILLTIPETIKKYYDILIEKDKALQSLIKDLNSDKYQRAFEITNKVQANINPMSGLGPEEYEPDKSKDNKNSITNLDVDAYIFREGKTPEKL